MREARFPCSRADSFRRRTGGRAEAATRPMGAAVIERAGPLNERAGCYAAVGRLLREAVAVGSPRLLRGDR